MSERRERHVPVGRAPQSGAGLAGAPLPAQSPTRPRTSVVHR